MLIDDWSDANKTFFFFAPENIFAKYVRYIYFFITLRQVFVGPPLSVDSAQNSPETSLNRYLIVNDYSKLYTKLYA